MNSQGLSMKSLMIWFGAAILLAVVVIGVLLLVGSKPGQQAAAPVYPELAKVAVTDESLGNKNSKVVIMEFSDFQCPACSYYYPIVEQVISNYSSTTQFVYRNFPLAQHANSHIAAYAAEAAGLQGKFWDMYAQLFPNQNDWADKSNIDAGKVFESYAAKIGLDLAKFKTDVVSSEVATKVQNDYQSGLDAGVDATPTFFLDGRKLDNVADYNSLKTLIDEEIKRN